MSNVVYMYGRKEPTPVEEMAKYVGPGWKDIIVRLVDDLYALGWDGQVAQVKEKFGGLRFYLNSEGTPEMFARIAEAEDESFVTSEFSGKPGELRDTGWLKVLDDEEWEEYQQTGSLDFLWEWYYPKEALNEL